MLLVVRFWEEFDENRDLARRIVGVFLLVVFRRPQNRRHSFTMCLRFVLLRDQTRGRKKSANRSALMRDERRNIFFFCSKLLEVFLKLLLSFRSFLTSGSFLPFYERISNRCFQRKK
jgi:hypothetical protein